MKARLAESDPHPYSLRIEAIVRDWWGKEIEVGQPERPTFVPRCGATIVYSILGPPILTELLKRKERGRYVCVHQIAEIVPNAHR